MAIFGGRTVGAGSGEWRRLTSHAMKQMGSRRISKDAVEAALEHGRVVHARGAEIHALGRKEVSFLRKRGLDLAEFEGVQVVCIPGGEVVTVYRNSDFRGLRERH